MGVHVEIQYVDTYDLTRLGQEVHGHASINQFERLIYDLPEQDDSQVSWTVKGELDAFGQRFLSVRIKATPTLECQRCMQPFLLPVDAESRLQVVKSEADLDVDDATADEADDPIERILGSQRFDVLALVEDELILSLPYVPKHQVCPSLPASLEEEPDAGEARPSPFAVLDQLKKN
jgi:uncharacterized protein